MTNEERRDTVRHCVAEALQQDLERVEMETSLIHELDADSLDFLDIVFRLEQAFGIQITRGEMESAARGDMSDDEFAPGGVISEAGLQRLRELMPEAGARIQSGLRPNEILSLFTTTTFLKIVENKLGLA